MSLLGLLHPTPVQAAATAYKQDFGTSSVLPCFLCSGHRTILNSLPQTPLPPGAVLPCSPPQNSPVFPDGTPRSSFLCPPTRGLYLHDYSHGILHQMVSIWWPTLRDWASIGFGVVPSSALPLQEWLAWVFAQEKGLHFITWIWNS